MLLTTIIIWRYISDFLKCDNRSADKRVKSILNPKKGTPIID